MSFNQSILEGLQSGFMVSLKITNLKIPNFQEITEIGLFIANVHDDTRYSAVQKLSC